MQTFTQFGGANHAVHLSMPSDAAVLPNDQDGNGVYASPVPGINFVTLTPWQTFSALPPTMQNVYAPTAPAFGGGPVQPPSLCSPFATASRAGMPPIAPQTMLQSPMPVNIGGVAANPASELYSPYIVNDGNLFFTTPHPAPTATGPVAHGNLRWVYVEPSQLMPPQYATQPAPMGTLFSSIVVPQSDHGSHTPHLGNAYSIVAPTPETGRFPVTYVTPSPALSVAHAPHTSSTPHSPSLYRSAGRAPRSPPPLPYFSGVLLKATSTSTMSSPLDHTLHSAESVHLTPGSGATQHGHYVPPHEGTCAAPMDVRGFTQGVIAPLDRPHHRGGAAAFYNYSVNEGVREHYKPPLEEGMPYELNPIPIDTNKTQLIVNFLPQRLTDEEFRALFRQYGELDEKASHIIYDFRHLRTDRPATDEDAAAGAKLSVTQDGCAQPTKAMQVRSKGYGFIYYRDGASTKRAIKELNGLEVYGRKIKVHYAVQQRVVAAAATPTAAAEQ